MPDAIEFSGSLEGFDQIGGAFKLFSAHADDELRRALISAAEWAVPRIREITPVGNDPDHAGRLRDSIGHSGVMESSEGLSIIVGSEQPYARRIELGFEGADSLNRVYHQAPQPYIEPVLDELLDELTREIRL